MSAFLAILRRHPVARAGAAGLFLFGFAGAAVSPFLPVVAIRELGMPDAAYSRLIFAAAVANVLASVAIGLFADRRAGYRRPLLAATALGAAGYATVWLLPSALTLALVLVGPLAAYNASNALIFAKVRSHAPEFTPAEAHDVGALLRLMISLAWILMPGATGLLLAGRATLLPAFLVAALLAGTGFAVLAAGLPPDRARPADGPRAGLADLRAFADPGLLLRVTALALASSTLHVNAAVLPLIVTGRAGGTVADVGVIVGYVALLEVVFIFVWAHVARRIPDARRPHREPRPLSCLPRCARHRPRDAAGPCRQRPRRHRGRGTHHPSHSLPPRPDRRPPRPLRLADGGEPVPRRRHRRRASSPAAPRSAATRPPPPSPGPLGSPAAPSSSPSTPPAGPRPMSRILLEVCVDDPEGLAAARAGGADRLELCAALALGGLTPSPALVAEAARTETPALAMIRPRPGDFVWTPAEAPPWRPRSHCSAPSASGGVVIGASLPDGRLDGPTLARLLAAARGLDVTLHRAVDLAPDAEEAVSLAIALGIPRILTSGGAASVADGLPRSPAC